MMISERAWEFAVLYVIPFDISKATYWFDMYSVPIFEDSYASDKPVLVAS